MVALSLFDVPEVDDQPQSRYRHKSRRRDLRLASFSRIVFRGNLAANALGYSKEKKLQFMVAVIPDFHNWLKIRKDQDPLAQGVPRTVGFSRLISRVEKSILRFGWSLEQIQMILEIMAPEVMMGKESRPTRHDPGSPGKRKVMQRRARAGKSLFHEEDSRSMEWLARLSEQRFQKQEEARRQREEG